MIIEKINIVNGSWSNLNSVQKELLPLPLLRDDLYWSDLCFRRDMIIQADPYIWEYSEEYFEEYIKKIIDCHFSAVDFFGSVFQTSYCTMDRTAYKNKFFSRTKYIQQLLLKCSSNIASPTINLINSSVRNDYCDFLIHFRNMFNFYFALCDFSLTEQNIALFTKNIQEFQRMLYKPLWISAEFKPSENPVRIQHFFNVMNSNFKDCKWFFSSNSPILETLVESDFK